MGTVLSFEKRGVGGDPRYRGNCSPLVYERLFDITKPQTFCDVMSGSGSALDAARRCGVEAWGFDLKDGFDAVRNDLLDALGQEVDLVTSHPPYLDIIKYSGDQWGEPHPADLSREDDIEVFYDYIQSVLLNQRRATRRGGHYATIIGDVRRRGEYHSLQAELLTRMRRDELAAVLIKAQHNVRSQTKSYKLRYPRIMHEYVLLWRKIEATAHALSVALVKEAHRRAQGTWHALVTHALRELGGEAPLRDIYRVLSAGAPERVKANQHYEAKVRQTLQLHETFHGVTRGVWAFA